MTDFQTLIVSLLLLAPFGVWLFWRWKAAERKTIRHRLPLLFWFTAVVLIILGALIR